MTDETYYRDVKFVDDHPSSSDEFRGQPHQGVAETLVSILTSGHGGRAIGLEGTWGSGKSTVIDIARSKLQNTNSDTAGSQKHTFFVFDAWAHQGDPLRRVSLQELIQCLDDDNAVDETYWNEELEKLETRRKKIIEQKAEKLSFWRK
jgi:predicted KAP-like P-loop ATPase